jgi:hypothetical protein
MSSKSINRNTSLVTPGALNRKNTRKTKPFRAESHGKGLWQVKESINSFLEYLSSGEELSEYVGQVASAPVLVDAKTLVNNYSSAFQEENDAQSYLKVYVRIPLEHMASPMTNALLEAGKTIASSAFFSNFKFVDEVVSQFYPYFLMPYDDNLSEEPPKVGDHVRVSFSDALKTTGKLLGIESRYPGSIAPLNQAAASSATGAFADLSRPISSVFKADVGPIAKLSDNPADLSGLCNGPTVTSSNGETVETIVIDNRLISRDIAPHLVSLLRDAKADGVYINLNSGFRIPFERDKFTKEEFNALTQDGNCVNWDGNPLPPRTNDSTTQEGLRNQNCAPPPLQPGVRCSPKTALPGNSAHQLGTGADMSTGMGTSRYSSPHRITKQYRWLSLNAWKYGFIRTVPSERWHWEFRPGFGQFSAVQRDNPLWDSQFNGRAVYDEDGESTQNELTAETLSS